MLKFIVKFLKAMSFFGLGVSTTLFIECGYDIFFVEFAVASTLLFILSKCVEHRMKK